MQKDKTCHDRLAARVQAVVDVDQRQDRKVCALNPAHFDVPKREGYRIFLSSLRVQFSSR